MTKQERNIILKTYEEVYKANLNGFNKSDTVKELSFMIDMLGLKKERFITENNIISQTKEYNTILIEFFEMVFNDFSKYSIYVNYNIDDIELYFEDLKYEMTEEEKKCNIARINYINDNIKRIAG